MRATSNRSRERGRSSRGTTRSGVSSTTARDARTRPRRDRDARERERERPRARSSARTRRVESIRIDSIRSIDRSNERPTEWAPDRTNERSVCDARAGGGRGRGWRRAMKGGSTRPRVPARIEGAGRARGAREAEGTRPNRSGVRREATDGGACD